MCDAICQHCTWDGVRNDIKQCVKCCKACQKGKRGIKNCGKLPAKDVEGDPWDEMAVDLAGPWKSRAHGSDVEHCALTIVDTATQWCEIIPITNKESENVSKLVDREWFCRCPRPLRCVCDNGSEFVGKEFQDSLDSYGVDQVGTTAKNPTANAVVKRIHAMMGNMIRAQIADTETIDDKHHDDPVPEMLAACAWGTCSIMHSTAQFTLGDFFSRHVQ